MADSRDDLLARLAALMLRDEVRLGRQLRRRDADLAAIDAEVVRAEDRVARRRSRTPSVSYPDELPVSARVEEIAAALRDHQVVVVAGETGSGKTTQLPKICLELGRGVRGAIAHTQPRRIAARAVAERLADELDVPLGQAVGYQVRFTRQTSNNTLVKVMTDGVLLAEIAHDPDLLAYDTVIVDEAHERSLNVDFLLGYLARLLPRRPDLRVVITSATIDPQRFADHFGGAPVVEVSGRTYPVEIRYRPYDEDAIDQVQAVIDAVAELALVGNGDVLVFLSGERQIRDAAEAMTRLELPGTEVLPLFGRLSAAEQHRVFASHPGRRIVLATNVAETSLTVPGIRYVVDTGTARISRYSHRLKVQRLPIEKVSQASAQQRAGRCGRVADGVCIRLYDEADFQARPAFTDPEILRTNLAAVILAMASLDLGEVAEFPFLDPPDVRSVRDGIALLTELGALRADRSNRPRLTDIGRQLARLPLDPRLARMVVAAGELSCVRDVLVVAAALTIQDPRERPTDAQAQADAMHQRFADDTSDVMAILGLWRYLEEQQDALSGSAFRRLCRAEHLHYLRIREWQDLVAQLRDVATRDLKLVEGEAWSHPDHVHRALLAGLLSHVGLKEPDGRDYLGARGVRFVIWPGSGLVRKQPRWVMAAELVETSRLFARVVAKVEPEWIEAAAADLVVRAYSEPTWDAKRGAVMAFERVTLYGVPLVARRRVGYARINPVVSREMFLRHALVEGDWESAHYRFLERNRETTASLQLLEDKARRRDLVADDDAVLAFYDARVPASVVSARHFDSWWKTARRETPDLLDLAVGDLLQGSAAPDLAQLPDLWSVGELRLPLTYRFKPGSPTDGVTVRLPLAVVNQVPAAVFTWHVPGLRHELATALIRGLPKPLRRLLVPAPDTAATALADLPVDERRPFQLALGATLLRQTGVEIPAAAWSPGSLPTHLRVHVEVSASNDYVLGRGDDLNELRVALAPAVRRAVAKVAPALEQTGLRRWPGDELPQRVVTEHDGLQVTGYPALLDEGETVGVRVVPTQSEQAAVMVVGTRRLLLLTVASPARAVLDAMSSHDKLALARDSGGQPAAVVRDCIAAAVDSLVASHGGPAWDAAGFATLRDRVAAGLASTTTAALRVAADIHAAAYDLTNRLAAPGPPTAAPAYDDLRHQLADLVPPEVATRVGLARLAAVLRYLQAMQRRLDRLPADIAKDLLLMDRIHAVEDVWHDALEAWPEGTPAPATLLEIRWTLEELRVSLFAQSLGTAYPVSEKRVLQAIDASSGVR